MITRGGGKLPSLLVSCMCLVIGYLVTIIATEESSWRESILALRETLALYHQSDIFVYFAKKVNSRCLQLYPFFLLFLVTPLSTPIEESRFLSDLIWRQDYFA